MRVLLSIAMLLALTAGCGATTQDVERSVYNAYWKLQQVCEEVQRVAPLVPASSEVPAEESSEGRPVSPPEEPPEPLPEISPEEPQPVEREA